MISERLYYHCDKIQRNRNIADNDFYKLYSFDLWDTGISHVEQLINFKDT